jgi:HD-GYP domain-containing protein (c-di-GMP phosphodiesterase class II)
VADIYDALTTDRPYRKRFTRSDSFAILRSMRDQLDQIIVEKFIRSFQESSESVQI